MQRMGLVCLGASAVWCLTGCFGPDDSLPSGDTDGAAGSTGESAGDEDDSLTTSISVGMGDDDEPGGESTGSTDFEPVERRIAEVTAEGMESLSNGFHYELWAIIDGSPATVGKFNIDAGGTVVDLQGIAVPDSQFDAGRDLREAVDFVITIEGAGDVDITPGVSKYLAGPSDEDTAELVVSDGRALGDDFAQSVGRFILATPTNGADTEEESGVWWRDLSVDPPAPGLVLPTLPPGWEYEGWAVIDGNPVTTGRFVGTNVEDFDDPFSGSEPGPMVPGEDFLVNAPDGMTFPTDLSGQTIVVSIEPEPDDSPLPFTLKPLVAEISPVAATHQSLAMELNLGSLPRATITLLE